MINKQQLEPLVKDALASYYSPAYLSTHPLRELIAAKHAERHVGGERVREVLAEALEAIRPPSSILFGRPEWLPYRIIFLRYLEGSDQPGVSKELGIARSTYYRYHQEGLQAIANILWAQFSDKSYADAAQPDSASLAQREATRVDRASPDGPIDTTDLVAGVLSTFGPLADSRGIKLRLDCPNRLPPLAGSLPVWRQVLLGILSVSARESDGPELSLDISVSSKSLQVKIGPLGLGTGTDDDVLSLEPLPVVGELLHSYGATLRVQRDHLRRPSLCIAAPLIGRASILIIDDDADTVALYQRYLYGQSCSVRAASCADEAWQSLAQERPQLIILDVFLPGEDGWEMLQRLKTQAGTADIPVVICSVLSQPSLAYSWGAAAVLQKPVAKEDLVDCLAEYIHQQGTSVSVG